MYFVREAPTYRRPRYINFRRKNYVDNLEADCYNECVYKIVETLKDWKCPGDIYQKSGDTIKLKFYFDGKVIKNKF